VVLSVKLAEKRIALGLKQALGDPWEEAVKRYPVGAVVEGPVTSLAAFGAFLDMGEGAEGMIHISDIVSGKRLQHPKEVLSAGQVVRAQVTEVDAARRRFRLSMKQLEPTAADEYIAEHHPGDKVTGRIVEVSGRRLKVELAEGVRAAGQLSTRTESAGESAGSGTDLSSSIAALAAKWKQGTAGRSGADGPKPGEIKDFRIVRLDPEKKAIEVELIEA
jgi:small subunit ribosomal protein S1